MSRNLYVLASVFAIGCFIGIGVWSYNTHNEVKQIAQETEQAYANNPVTHVKALLQGAETVHTEMAQEFRTKATEFILSAKTIEKLIVSTISFGMLATIGLVLFDMMVIEPTLNAIKRVAQTTRTKYQVWRFNRAKAKLEQSLAQIEQLRQQQ